MELVGRSKERVCIKYWEKMGKNNIYLRHGLIIGLFLRIGPIHNNITAPNLDTASFQSAFGKTSRLMGFIFQEAKSSAKRFSNLRC